MRSEAMYRVAIAIVLCVLPFSYGTYLPSIYWDPSNPILEKQYWHQVTPTKIYDFVTFICPNNIMKMRGRDTMNSMTGLNHNLYVKEIAADITNFDGACDTTENATFIKSCYEPQTKPKELNYQEIQINIIQAHEDAPTFKYGRDYMFFATSDGTKKSLNTTSKNCTMVFRIHFNQLNETTALPSSPFFGRDKVCENPSSSPKPQNPTSKSKENETECNDVIPKELSVTETGANSVTLTWELPEGVPSCNVTHYTVCYQTNMTESCKVFLVQAKKQTVTLTCLKPNEKYTCKVRAHTAKGPGEYCKDITFKTKTTEPDISADKRGISGKQNTSIDGKSIAIGFVVGVILTLILGIAFWIYVTRFYKRKDLVGDKDEQDTNINNPNFYTGDKEMNEVLTLNNGYRESGANWPKLTPVAEENTHLYVSDA